MYGTVPYLFGFLLLRFDRLILFSNSNQVSHRRYGFAEHLLPDFFRIGTYFPPRLEVSYVFGVPISSGATSTSLSSSSVSVSAVLPFWTILSFPFRMSRSISSQRPYFPSRPRRQCRFFGLISPLALIVDSFFALRLV